MQKEVKTQTTDIEYYCDICGKEAYNYYDHEPTLRHCDLCNKEVCPECYIKIPTVNRNVPDVILCKECASRNKDLLDKMTANIRQFNTEDTALRKLLFKKGGVNNEAK